MQAVPRVMHVGDLAWPPIIITAHIASLSLPWAF